MNKTIGILGGIGPEASAIFYLKLIERIKSLQVIKSNQDYPHIIINNINAPEILQYNDNTIEDYITGVKAINLHQPDYIYMICNTIHIYIDQIVRESKCYKIINLKDLVYKKIHKINKKICLLGTENTIKSGLYSFSDINYIDIPEKVQQAIQTGIIGFNRGENIKNETYTIQQYINHTENTLFICGCTEVRSLTDIDSCNVDFIDTMDLFLDDIIYKLYGL